MTFLRNQQLFGVKSVYYVILSWLSCEAQNCSAKKVYFMLFWVVLSEEPTFLPKKVYIILFWVDFTEEPTIFWLKKCILWILCYFELIFLRNKTFIIRYLYMHAHACTYAYFICIQKHHNPHELKKILPHAKNQVIWTVRIDFINVLLHLECISNLYKKTFIKSIPTVQIGWFFACGNIFLSSLGVMMFLEA